MNPADTIQKNPRLAAVKILLSVMPSCPISTQDSKPSSGSGKSLSALLPLHLQALSSSDKSLTSSICYGVLRYYPSLCHIVDKNLSKALRKKDRDIYITLLSGCYQLVYMRTPDHAVISESVDLSLKLKKKWAKGLINAVLRNIQRDIQKNGEVSLDTKSNEVEFNHPDWMIKILKKDWPNNWKDILINNNVQAPLNLRLNKNFCEGHEYIKLLQDQEMSATESSATPNSIQLKQASDVLLLPNFSEGWCSVQDEAAQQAAHILQAENGEKVLDACAAPGGKSGHILELANECQLTCIDNDAIRLERVNENLNRLQLKAEVTVGDISDPDTWWDGELFDRILLDAPCSASGIIRRHPDIKWLRKEGDIQQLTDIQLSLLNALWPLLKPEGTLVYSTCSVFNQENEALVSGFLKCHDDITPSPIESKLGLKLDIGLQLFPKKEGHDGFYYARFKKISP